ncbi:hypothetical protein MATL_G00023430 [Megalops atlanticus]|uniref:Transferrin receptor protein 1 n=1 Tax=Megalops atlanticus TaxID=7932 RepID=A0A9D3QBF5_MEGAT|nr:hypothetical protein MATL_G00023430 [Megalops atlanticus]
MAATMDHARSTISKIFCGEPRSYMRFNLAQNIEGDSSQVEMKLSNDDEEAPNSEGTPRHQDTYSRRPPRPAKNVIFYVIGVLLIFVIGYLIGYLTNRRQDLKTADCTPDSDPEPEAFTRGVTAIEAEPTLDWSDIRNLLRGKLSAELLQGRLREFSLSSHEAGTDGDEQLANGVFSAFKMYGMNPWTDEHFVKLQSLSSASPNKVQFGAEEIGRPKGYLAYSASGTKQGRVVYAHYGQPEDLKYVADMKIDLAGSVVLLRAGKISFAEKVANAAKVKAVAVLIYPDPANYSNIQNEALYGHVHLGSGDPFTPGFPSFNHTQFPPAQSSGLPGILAQTITADMAAKIFQKMGGINAPSFWDEGRLPVVYKLGSENDTVSVEVNNVLVEKKIHNVFGVIKGFVDADRYVVIGAQRDSWGPGYAKSTVGTTMLVELARAISDMVEHDGFRPRRSIVFASWSAGEYGSVGTTEWLEGYLASLNMKAFTYINLDGAVTGSQTFKAAASPLLYRLIQTTLREVISPKASEKTLFEEVSGSNWELSVMESMRMDDSAYPFMAFSGIPSVSFRFTKSAGEYEFLGTAQDNEERLSSATEGRTAQFATSAAQFAGQMALRLVHDHLLRLDVERYVVKVRSYVSQINHRIRQLRQSNVVSAGKLEALTVNWLASAVGSFGRASTAIISDMKNSDLNDVEACRIINDRLMGVEHNFLSPYVSAKDVPFHHIVFGSGSHTLAALVEHLNALKVDAPESDTDLFRNQFALATWTIQGCANTLAGNVWALDNEI